MMRVTFRCKASGNTVSFIHEHDIESMRKDASYDEVKDTVETEVKPVDTIIPEKKKVGRPRLNE